MRSLSSWIEARLFGLCRESMWSLIRKVEEYAERSPATDALADDAIVTLQCLASRLAGAGFLRPTCASCGESHDGGNLFVCKCGSIYCLGCFQQHERESARQRLDA